LMDTMGAVFFGCDRDRSFLQRMGFLGGFRDARLSDLLWHDVLRISWFQ